MPADTHPLEILTPFARSRLRNLVLAGSVVCSTSREVVAALSFEEGGEWRAEDLLAAVADSEPKVASARAMRLVEHRERSSGELATRLAEDGYAPETIKTTVARFVELGLIDDVRYTDLFIRSKVSAGWGTRRITDSLRRMQIPDDLALERLIEIGVDDETDYSRALSLARKKPPADRAAVERSMARLVRRGFSFDIARRAAQAAYAEHEAEPT
jgi:regulatory protein